MTNEFPAGNCYICDERIGDKKEGFIVASNFVDYLDSRLLNYDSSHERLLESEESEFVNVITSNYFSQFYDHFHPNKARVIELGEFSTEMAVEAKAHKYRLERILTKKPEGFLFLFGHGVCIPEKTYEIGLANIDTREKALQWTRHLGEKPWFNLKGWLHILDSLYEHQSIRSF